jgi:hypothetical protein
LIRAVCVVGAPLEHARNDLHGHEVILAVTSVLNFT